MILQVNLAVPRMVGPRCASLSPKMNSAWSLVYPPKWPPWTGEMNWSLLRYGSEPRTGFGAWSSFVNRFPKWLKNHQKPVTQSHCATSLEIWIRSGFNVLSTNSYPQPEKDQLSPDLTKVITCSIEKLRMKSRPMQWPRLSWRPARWCALVNQLVDGSNLSSIGEY